MGSPQMPSVPAVPPPSLPPTISTAQVQAQGQAYRNTAAAATSQGSTILSSPMSADQGFACAGKALTGS
jgi:hypothetical protein